MKNKNLIYLVVLVVLLAVAGWLLSSQPTDSTLERTQDYSFTIEDTAAIDKIIIKDKTPAEITLTREKNRWMVDGEFKARDEAVNTLLETLHRMQMRNFLAENIKPTVIKRMTVFGKEVQIFKNGLLFKTIYVGTETHDEMATYMMIKGSDAPYAVYIPGFNGYLSSRFFTQSHLWRSRDVALMKAGEIKEVEMVYPDSSASSFKISVFNRDSLFVTQSSTGKVLRKVNQVKVKLFLAALSKLKYEGAILATEPISRKRDSLLASTPVFYLQYKNMDGKATRLEGYKIKGPAESFDPERDAPEYDLDRMHGFINQDRMVLLQYHGMRGVFKSVNYFTKP